MMELVIKIVFGVFCLWMFHGFVTREERNQRDRDEGPRSMIR